MWLYFGGGGASLKFRQFESAVFDALGCFALWTFVLGLYLSWTCLGGGVLDFWWLCAYDLTLLWAFDPKVVSWW